VTLAEWVEAFYTAPVFRIERWILGALIKKPSSDAEARELSMGGRDAFSAWRVFERTDTQILLGDFQGKTRSWLAVLPQHSSMLLYFGSGIRSVPHPKTGAPSLTWGFRVLSGFHLRYSAVLLATGRRHLAAGR
jgi:hypothetical protein